MAGPTLDLSGDFQIFDGVSAVQLAKRSDPTGRVPHQALRRAGPSKEAIARARGGTTGTGGYYIDAIQRWEVPIQGMPLQRLEVGDLITDADGVEHQIIIVLRSDITGRYRCDAVAMDILLPDQVVVQKRLRGTRPEGDPLDEWQAVYQGPGKVHLAESSDRDVDDRRGLRGVYQIYLPERVPVGGHMRVVCNGRTYEVQAVESPDEITRLQVVTAEQVAG